MKQLKGIPVSPGVVMGRVFFLETTQYRPRKHPIPLSGVKEEIERFRKALRKTEETLKELREKVIEEIGEKHGYIFDAHLLFLKDELFVDNTIKKIREEKITADYAVSQVIEHLSEIFAKIEDPYLKERHTDIADVGRRIVENLIGVERENLANLTEEVIVVAHDLSPSDTASMNKKLVIGFATDVGGRTSHTAIIARSLEIPAVVGLENITEEVKTNDIIIVDGTRGTVTINPTPAEKEFYYKRKRELARLRKIFEKTKELSARTTDGHKITIYANIEFGDEVSSVQMHGAEGIGLYRTEFLYMNRSDLPTEDEQFETYRKVASQMKPYPVVIRTLDLGGDKFLSNLGLPQEVNPFLGWRAIRFCLQRRDIFETQLRAILRASIYGNLKIMFPLVTNLEELKQAKGVVREVKEQLVSEGVPFDEGIELGVMIEVPSAAMIADVLAKEVDFFSIGTNDLIQYSLAIDRSNERIAYLYEPFHPGVLRLIQRVIEEARREGINVEMCGEMAGDPLAVIVLLGLGLERLSMSAVVIPEIKKIVRSISRKEAQTIAKTALSFSSAVQTREYLKAKVARIVGLKEVKKELLE